jgi:hypothetical protein
MLSGKGSMRSSNIKEIGWKDIGETVLGTIAGLPIYALETISGALDKMPDAKTSRYPWLTKPLAHAWQKTKDFVDLTGDTGPIGVFGGSYLAGIAAGIFAGCHLAVALGFTWSGLLAGAGIGAAAIGIGTGIVAASLAATACLVTTAIVFPITVANVPQVFRLAKLAYEGLKESRVPRAAPKPQKAAAPAPPPLSALMQDFNYAAGLLEKQDESMRRLYLAHLRRKFPADFADAMRAGRLEPVLRKDITVCKRPLRLNAKCRKARRRPA